MGMTHYRPSMFNQSIHRYMQAEGGGPDGLSELMLNESQQDNWLFSVTFGMVVIIASMFICLTIALLIAVVCLFKLPKKYKQLQSMSTTTSKNTMSDSESRLMIELDDMSLTDLIAAEKVAESELQTGSILSVIACNHCGKLSVEPSKTEITVQRSHKDGKRRAARSATSTGIRRYMKKSGTIDSFRSVLIPPKDKQEVTRSHSYTHLLDPKQQQEDERDHML